MPWTGLTILLFALFHLAHYTLGVVDSTKAHDLPTRAIANASYLNLVDVSNHHDVYSMVVAGPKEPPIAILYILAQLALLVHLSHGISSVFQTLGLNTPRIQPFISLASKAIAFVIVAGNIAIVVAVWSSYIAEVDRFVR